jgi:hypothetical protein
MVCTLFRTDLSSYAGAGLTERPLSAEEGDGLSVAGHMVAGSCAGVAEHCVFFPIDTLKTRIQVRHCCVITEDSSAETNNALRVPAAPVGCSDVPVTVQLRACRRCRSCPMRHSTRALRRP